ncbi:S9 family peptidase [Sphingomicrobium nitratireducens]|uniref:S9 family peptidase n=1 Tax=Sphingomicrobium nitratireducens TaxID=2964666 RepID=UPI00223EF3A0|nr:S9 family peptidase [Sphingomicrobium nitratireducens]
MRLSLLLAATAMTVATPALAEDLTLERIFASPTLDGGGQRGLALSPDGTLMTMLKPRPNDRQRYDLWALDTGSGEWRMLIDSEKVGSGAELSEDEKMQRERKRIGSLRGIVSYQWAPDGKSILVPLDGDLYLATLDGKVVRLTETEASELNPAISEEGGYVSFVRDRRLFVGPADGSEDPVPVTPVEDSETIHWGEAEFVAQEEMDRSDGYWWAPGDRRVAVARYDEAPVDIVTRTRIGGTSTTTYEQRYPAAGTDNVLIELWVIEPATGARTKVDLGEDADIYLARVDWAPDGKTLFVQRENRAQTRLDMLAVDPATGASSLLFSETAAERHWINLSDAYEFLDDGSLVWRSERDGFGHLYLRGADGSWRQLTRGEWVVSSLLGVDEEAGRLYFAGNRETVLETHAYALDYRDSGAEPVRLTEQGFTHMVKMDDDAKAMTVSRSSPDQPWQTYLADANGKRIAWIDENRLDADHPYAPYLDSHQPTRFGTIEAEDGTPLHYRMILPANMEPGKRYPVFSTHYGGPHAQTVKHMWSGAIDQWLADQGYIVFELDNRGMAYRGVAFEQPIWRAMGKVEVEDQKRGHDFLKTLDYVDPDRIAIHGGSYGGYMTLKMLAANPGFYAAGVAIAPVSKWELYDTFYTERYMGDPREVQAAYDASSTFAGAEKIADPLILIHGMSDDNVVFDNSTAMAAALQEAKVPFEMMFYPGYTHRIAGPNISVHLWRTIMNFLARNGVEGGPR